MRRSFPLSPHLLDRYDDRAVIRRLRRTLGHVDFTISRAERLVHVRGPIAPYHAVDPCLSSGLARLEPTPTRDNALAYRKPGAAYDLCLADSWSGYFVAEWLRQSPEASASDIVFIHLDDHTAMTPPLISHRGGAFSDDNFSDRDVNDGNFSDGDLSDGGSRDGGFGCNGVGCAGDAANDDAFDAHRPADWVRAIESGVIGIGSFLTLLFYLRPRVHVRHLNSDTIGAGTTYDILRAVKRHPALPGLAFASTRKVRARASSATSSSSSATASSSPSPSPSASTLVNATPATRATSETRATRAAPGTSARAPRASTAGTYRAGWDAKQVLADLPAGNTIVHIDLDYLINDFNGRPVDPPLGRAWSPVLETRITAECRLQAFFNALIARDVRVDHWIVAASPGFCSASHWPLLLHRIEVGIQRLAAREPADESTGRPYRESRRSR